MPVFGKPEPRLLLECLHDTQYIGGFAHSPKQEMCMVRHEKVHFSLHEESLYLCQEEFLVFLENNVGNKEMSPKRQSNDRYSQRHPR